MKPSIKTVSLLIPFMLLVGCGTLDPMAPPSANQGASLPIDQIPKYGGMDRQAIPELKKGDDALIMEATSAFGSREQAAAAWVEQGFRFYKSDDNEKAMRRFNQAWLLDSKNPGAYWGFGAVLHDRGLAFGAYDMELRAYQLGLRDVSFLADLGRVAALRTSPAARDAKELTPEQRKAFLSESESYYEEAIKRGEQLGYIYDSWSSARYWEGDYVGAWEKVKAARAHGGATNEHFLSMLTNKMVEPK